MTNKLYTIIKVLSYITYITIMLANLYYGFMGTKCPQLNLCTEASMFWICTGVSMFWIGIFVLYIDIKNGDV